MFAAKDQTWTVELMNPRQHIVLEGVAKGLHRSNRSVPEIVKRLYWDEARRFSKLIPKQPKYV